jgi:hypothetical protein
MPNAAMTAGRKAGEGGTRRGVKHNEQKHRVMFIKLVVFSGGVPETVVTDNNKINTVNFNSVAPDGSNQIVVTLTRETGSSFQYLNGFKLTKIPAGSRAAPGNETTPEFAQSRPTLSLNPNPATNTLRVAFTSNKIGNLRFNIYDAMGRLVQSRSFVKNDIQLQQHINVAALGNGLYYVSIQEDNGKSIVSKFLKQ